MNEKKKIALIIPSLNAGGMERVMSEMANYFVLHENLSIHLIMYGRQPTIFYTLNTNIILHTPKEKFNDSLRPLYTLKRLIYVRKKIKEIQPDVILSFGELWNNFVLLSMKGLKIPIFVSDRCKPDKNLGRFHNNLRKWLYPTSKAVIIQTQKAKVIYEQFIPKNKIKVIGNPIRKIENTHTEKKKKLS